jgi:hypothetical protein
MAVTVTDKGTHVTQKPLLAWPWEAPAVTRERAPGVALRPYLMVSRCSARWPLVCHISILLSWGGGDGGLKCRSGIPP